MTEKAKNIFKLPKQLFTLSIMGAVIVITFAFSFYAAAQWTPQPLRLLEAMFRLL